MAGSSSLHEELGALRAELRPAAKPEAERRHDGPEAPSSAASDEAAPSVSLADLEGQLSELGKALSGYTGSVEDFVAEHPLASVLAAFALGVAVGRMMGRA